MPRLNEYLSVGFCAGYGDADYAVKCSVADLTYEQMRDLRSITCVAIGAMERMWMEEQEKKQRGTCFSAASGAGGKDG